MPFNGSGVFQRLYDWTTDRDAGTKIIADRVDAETDGIVAGINDVVDQTQGFIGAIKGTNGTVSSPAYSFTDDTNTGMYRVSADTLGFAVNGVLEGQFEAGFFDVVNGLKIGGVEVTATAAELNEAGDFAGTFTLPASDGTAGQVLQTDGAGAITFDTVDAATTAQGTKADTAHGWGDHSIAGYTTSAPNSPAITFSAGTGLTGGGSINLNQSHAETITFNASGGGATDIDGLSDASTNGTGNLYLGYNLASAIGSSNTVVGLNCFDHNGFNLRNVVMGNYTADGSPNGANDNVFIGYGVSRSLTSADGNVMIGASCGAGLTTGSNNIGIGHSCQNITTGTNTIVIGYNANPTDTISSNEITLGNSSISTLRCQQTTITALSDRRDKANITDISLGLDYINEIRPVEFDWAMREESDWNGKHVAGFIAQELMAVEDANGAEFLGSVLRANPERLEVGPAALLPVMVKAIQELSAKVAELEARHA